jgi:hypothetical protein
VWRRRGMCMLQVMVRLSPCMPLCPPFASCDTGHCVTLKARWVTRPPIPPERTSIRPREQMMVAAHSRQPRAVSGIPPPGGAPYLPPSVTASIHLTLTLTLTPVHSVFLPVTGDVGYEDGETHREDEEGDGGETEEAERVDGEGSGEAAWVEEVEAPLFLTSSNHDRLRRSSKVTRLSLLPASQPAFAYKYERLS